MAKPEACQGLTRALITITASKISTRTPRSMGSIFTHGIPAVFPWNRMNGFVTGLLVSPDGRVKTFEIENEARFRCRSSASISSTD